MQRYLSSVMLLVYIIFSLCHKNIFCFKFDKDEIYEIKKMDVFLNMIGEQYQKEEKLRESFNKTRDIIVGEIVKR